MRKYMTDKEFLSWIYDRMIYKYGENENVDYLHRFKRIIDSLQEEPVSIWHNSNEEQPNYASTVAIWNPKYKNGEIISRCTEVYSDRIWAYIDDLLKI